MFELALRGLRFTKPEARRALDHLTRGDAPLDVQALLRGAIALLTPPAAALPP